LTFLFFYDIIVVSGIGKQKHEQMFVRTNDRANKRSPGAQRLRAYREELELELRAGRAANLEKKKKKK
jgi:hypothetical protein